MKNIFSRRSKRKHVMSPETGKVKNFMDLFRMFNGREATLRDITEFCELSPECALYHMALICEAGA